MSGQNRRSARARAFQALFEAEFERVGAGAALARSEAEAEIKPLAQEERAYADTLTAGVSQRIQELDAIISETAHARPIWQMSLVDLTVLRIALYELLFNTEAVSASTATREAVELAKRYGSDGSRRLVSGVLGTIRRTRLTEPVEEDFCSGTV